MASRAPRPQAAAHNLRDGVRRRLVGRRQQKHGRPFRHTHAMTIAIHRMGSRSIDNLQTVEPVIRQTAQGVGTAHKHTSDRAPAQDLQRQLDAHRPGRAGRGYRQHRSAAATFFGHHIGHRTGGMVG